MRAPGDTSWHVRGAGAWVALSFLAGCSAILGFHHALPNGPCETSDNCAPNQSCAAGQCADHCSSDRDCASGQRCPPADGVCVAVSAGPLDGSQGDGGEAGTDATGSGDDGADDKGPPMCGDGSAYCDSDGADGCVDLTSDPANCGQCGHACNNSPCVNSLCTQASRVGYWTAGTGVQLVSAHEIFAWRLPALSDGFLWKIGAIVNKSTFGIRAVLGVYVDDGSGRPTTLVAAKEFVTGESGTEVNEVVIAPPLPPVQAQKTYYVAILGDANDAGSGPILAANTGPAVTGFGTAVASFTSNLPAMASFPETFASPQPDVYIVIAQ